MKYKLFLSDFDWTLGLAPDFIEEETVKAIKEYQKKGGIFVICTGRSYLSIKKVCEKYGIKGVVIGFQGALACDLATDKVIFDGGVERTIASEVVRDLLDMGFEAGAYLDDLFHYEKAGVGINEYIRLVGVGGVAVDDISSYILNTDKKVKKALAIGEPDAVDNGVAVLSKKYEGKLIVNKSSKHYLEVISPEWSKGEAVKKIAKYYGVSLSEVIAVGDSTNDISLLDGEWHGVCVGDGMDELKKYAKEITVPFKDQPIKVLLEKYCL